METIAGAFFILGIFVGLIILKFYNKSKDERHQKSYLFHKKTSEQILRDMSHKTYNCLVWLKQDPKNKDLQEGCKAQIDALKLIFKESMNVIDDDFRDDIQSKIYTYESMLEAYMDG